MQISSSPFLSVNNLSVTFKTRNGLVSAIEEVSINVNKGEVVGIVGESGSGKSVTAYSIIGLLDPAGKVVAGKNIFDGIDLTRAKESDLRDIRGREISMIFQNPRAALNPIRPVGKQIEDVLIQHLQATHDDAHEKAVEMLDKVKINDPKNRYWSYPFQLSGGMCQRVMIAMAVACNPRLLIADEPTTGLDVTTQKATMDLIQELTQQQNMSVILITHDLGLAAQYCDRIVVMQKGKVVESAYVKTLFTNPQHAYTKKLIAATPDIDSSLQDLNVVPDEMEEMQLDIVLSTKSAIVSPHGNDFMEVIDLVKEFPFQDHSRSFWDWKKGTKKDKVFRAVDGISFTLQKGESLGLVGESGCGKSTTSSIINRLLDQTSGDVILDGENITTYSSKLFARMPQRMKIQMVFQDPTDSLNPRFTAKESISEPLRRLKGYTSGKRLNSKIEQLAQKVGLPSHLLTRFPHQLSGGQKARVGIARAIAVDPTLLVLDEPTSALDVSVQAVVLQLLDRLKRELGMSYIFVSHDLNVVKLLCDRIIVMNKGTIVETGTSDEVLNAPKNEYTRTLISAIPHFSRTQM